MKYNKKSLIILFFLLLFNNLQAKNILDYEDRFKKIAKKYNIYWTLLATVVLTENEKLQINVVRHNTNGTEDIGFCQINTIHLKNKKIIKHFGHITKKDLLNPDLNLKVAAFLLSEHIKNGGYNFDSIGNYHSKNQKYKKRWLKRFKKKAKILISMLKK